MKWTTYASVFATFVSIVAAHADHVVYAPKAELYKGVTCKCDSPPCDGRFLNKDSLCQCQYNAALFCYNRMGQACESPLPQACGRVLSTPAVTSGAKPTYTPPYQGAGGLNCVEIGYCSRPTKAKTTMTITNANGTQVITVPVGAVGGVGQATLTDDDDYAPATAAPATPTADASYDPYAGVNYPSPPSWNTAEPQGLVTAVPIPGKF